MVITIPSLKDIRKTTSKIADDLHTRCENHRVYNAVNNAIKNRQDSIEKEAKAHASEVAAEAFFKAYDEFMEQKKRHEG